MRSGFLERWLSEHGAPASQIEALEAQTRARAARYPGPIARAYPAFLSLIEWAAPALLMGSPRRASRLPAEAFASLEAQLQNHPATLVKLLYLLVRTPGLEALYPDTTPTAPPHPLVARAEVIRARAARTDGEFDAIVIGSGAGGAPLAWSLARSGARVAVVEAGALMRTATTQAALEKFYMTQGMVGSIEGLTLVLAGEAVGGTTVINSGTSLRPTDEALAQWDALSGVRLSEALLPWFEVVEAQIGVQPSAPELLDASSGLLNEGLRALGRDPAFVLPRNAPGCKGSARCCFGCPTGAKQSTDRSFLPGAVDAGATLLWETRAIDVREHSRGVEVLVEDRAGKRLLRGARVVIAAGALSTPHLLRQNRLGSHWRAAGNHLKIHPASKVFAMMPGPLRHGGVPQGVGLHEPTLPRITFEGIHTPAAAAAPMLSLAGPRHREWMSRYDQIATFGMMCRDRGVGRVRGQGITRRVNYRLDPEDARDIGAGLLWIAEVMFAAGAERVTLPVTGLAAEYDSLEALKARRPEAFTPDNLLSAGFHPQGTAGIGRVVDADLKLKGSDRVYVCDASVLPDSPGNNPQISIMALALRLGAEF